MTEVTRNHELEGLRGASRIPRHHRVASHDFADGGMVGVESFGGDLGGTKSANSCDTEAERPYSISQVLRGEDSAEALLIVHDEYTVGSLGCAKLTGFGDGNSLGNSQGGAGLQGSDSALGWRRLSSSSSARGGMVRAGDGALAGQLTLNLLSDSLSDCTTKDGKMKEGPRSVTRRMATKTASQSKQSRARTTYTHLVALVLLLTRVRRMAVS